LNLLNLLVLVLAVCQLHMVIAMVSMSEMLASVLFEEEVTMLLGL